MKSLLLASIAGIALLATGCASVVSTAPADLNGQKIATEGTNVAHINAQNWGFYFLSFPIATGSATSPGMTAWFSEDSVTIPCTVGLATAKAKELGATSTLDLQSSSSSTMIPIPFPFLFYMKSTNVSGNAVR